MRGVSRWRADGQFITNVAPQFARKWKNNKRYFVRSKTCLVCCFGVSLANPTDKTISFQFFVRLLPSPLHRKRKKDKEMVLADGSPSGARRAWCGCVARITTKLSLRRVGAELPQALAVERAVGVVRNRQQALRAVLFLNCDFGNRFGICEITESEYYSKNYATI